MLCYLLFLFFMCFIQSLIDLINCLMQAASIPIQLPLCSIVGLYLEDAITMQIQVKY